MAVVGGGIAAGVGGGNGIGAGGYGYGYAHPFVQAPLLPLFSTQQASSSVSGSAIGSGGSEDSASTVSEYWPHAAGSGSGFRYWNDSAPRGGAGVVNAWRDGRRTSGSWGRDGRASGVGVGVGYATMEGLREARERTERAVGRLEGSMGRERAGGYRLWSWE